MYQPVTAKPKRPAVVTIAAVIMGLMALLHLASAVVTFVAVNRAAEAFRELARNEQLRPGEIDAGIGTLRIGFICSGVVLVLFALLLAGLAWGILRGSQPARVVTWVVCGLGVLCACCSAIPYTASFSELNGIAVDRDQMLGNLVVQSLPDWAGGILLGSSGLNLLGYIATAVLLALPAANTFFRGVPPTGWQPPNYPPPPAPYPPPPAHPSHPAPPPSTL